MYTTHYPKGLRQKLAFLFMKVFNWKPILEPLPGPKVVAVGYPHTSNWDFFPALFWMWTTGLKASFIGKKQLFTGILGPLMRRLGGIPVDRSKTTNFVDQVVEIIEERQEIVLIIAPEGTRGYAPYWRTGFYYMALGAGVPIALGFIDWGKREVGIAGYLMPTGDINADFEKMKTLYANKVGRNHKKQGPLVLKSSGKDTNPLS